MRKHLLYILCGMLLLTGCDYLNRVPEKDIETVESLFEQRTKAESWWKGPLSSSFIEHAEKDNNNVNNINIPLYITHQFELISSFTQRIE